MTTAYGLIGATDDRTLGATNTTTRRVVIAAGQTLPRGAVMGQALASGEYFLAIASATNGSDEPSAILAEAINTTAGAAPGVVHDTGRFVSGGLVFSASLTIDTIRSALRRVGIQVDLSV